MKEKVIALYQAKRELTLLQGTFLGLTLLSLMVAGLLALINQSVGVAALAIPALGAVILTVNTVAWALIRMVIENTIKRDAEVKKAVEKELKKK